MSPKFTPSEPPASFSAKQVTSAHPESLRQSLHQNLKALRRQTLELVDGLSLETLCQQAHPDFSPVGWHLGHIAYTEGLWILEKSAGLPPCFPEYRQLFAADGLPKAERSRLPTATVLFDYLQTIRQQVLDYLAVLDGALLQQQERLWRWLLQHEAQHSETIMLVLQLQTHPLPSWSALPQTSMAVVEVIPPAPPQPTAMVQIPAGEFDQGWADLLALDNERPGQRVYLPDFWLDRYPVTRAQYRQFMLAGGYSNSRWWSEAGWTWLQEHPVAQPLYWHTIVADDHPVCGVSYYEAEAYANFVGKRLPTEAEWEKAARWQPQTGGSHTYPWGEQPPSTLRCNHGHQVGQSTPVNQYPQGQSACGCYDLLGNVWEWTATWFQPYPGFASFPYPGYSAAYFDNRHRVLKGGSWATQTPALRASFRNWYAPGTREIFAGFRCASDTPPAPERATKHLATKHLATKHLVLENLLTSPDLQTHESGADVVKGLTQIPKTLPPKYFYDDHGSQLFEQICTLPEYYPTRTEAWILRHYAVEIARLTGACELVELGSGSSTKTRLLLDAYGSLAAPLYYLPIDVSGGILSASAQDLLATYPQLQVHGLVATYELGLAHLPPRRAPSRMIAFLGSTLGNLNPTECRQFLSRVRAALQPGEFFLLGVDLQKPLAILEAAYNDTQGVTAEFNLNMLRHLNRRFGGNFVLEQFRHRAIYNPQANQIEMHLDSLVNQGVELTQLGLSVEFQTGESVLTEISRKFSLPELQQELTAHRLLPRQTWTDPQGWFGLMLCQCA